jgi:hypothetical protein
MSIATTIRDLERLRDEAADDEQTFAGKLSDAQRRRKHWERRIAEENGDLPASHTTIFKDRPGLDELVRGAALS